MTQSPSDSDRRAFYLDWLRIGAMAAVFFFHCGRAFDTHGWHIKNDVTTQGFTVFSLVLVQWMMPILFLISGWVSYLVLQKSDMGAFVRSRVKRLLVPFIVGTLILIPHQVYVERVTQAGVTERFLTWFPQYFDGFYAFGGNFAWMGLHLWYLEMLFIFSLLFLPLLLWLRHPAEACRWPVSFIWLSCALPLLAVELLVALFPESIGRQDFGGWSLLTYMVWFWLGYLIGRNVQFQHALIAARHVSLAIAATSLAAGFMIVLSDDIDFGYVGNLSVRIGVAWGGIAAFLGYAAHHLNFDAVPRRALNEAILPFYILHQSVIVLIAFYVVPLPLSPSVKFGLIAGLSLAMILVAYVFIVRRFGPLRFVFGMPYRQ